MDLLPGIIVITFHLGHEYDKFHQKNTLAKRHEMAGKQKD